MTESLRAIHRLARKQGHAWTDRVKEDEFAAVPPDDAAADYRADATNSQVEGEAPALSWTTPDGTLTWTWIWGPSLLLTLQRDAGVLPGGSIVVAMVQITWGEPDGLTASPPVKTIWMIDARPEGARLADLERLWRSVRTALGRGELDARERARQVLERVRDHAQWPADVYAGGTADELDARLTQEFSDRDRGAAKWN